MQHATLTTEQVRALIARGKLRDTLFQALGIFFLGVGLIVIFLLVGDMVLRGAGRLNLDFFTQFASRRAGRKYGWSSMRRRTCTFNSNGASDTVRSGPIIRMSFCTPRLFSDPA